jgi:putative SOS response-associated peptidase YedK
MCGRYSLGNPDQLALRFEAELNDALKPRYDVRPTQVMPVVVNRGSNQIELMQWGLIPAWAKEPKPIINARAETVAEKPSFKRAFVSSRCLIPASSFYEWQETKSGKQPHLFKLKSQDLFAMAGLCSLWKSPQGEAIPTYAILTTAANGVVGKVHQRMPVILRQADERLWLDPDLKDPDFLQGLLNPFPASQMTAYPVSSELNRPDVADSPALIQPLDARQAYTPDLV